MSRIHSTASVSPRRTRRFGRGRPVQRDRRRCNIGAPGTTVGAHYGVVEDRRRSGRDNRIWHFNSVGCARGQEIRRRAHPHHRRPQHDPRYCAHQSRHRAGRGRHAHRRRQLDHGLRASPTTAASAIAPRSRTAPRSAATSTSATGSRLAASPASTSSSGGPICDGRFGSAPSARTCPHAGRWKPPCRCAVSISRFAAARLGTERIAAVKRMHRLLSRREFVRAGARSGYPRWWSSFRKATGDIAVMADFWHVTRGIARCEGRSWPARAHRDGGG